jgi:tRNA (guanine-N7-)-methyltransferase
VWSDLTNSEPIDPRRWFPGPGPVELEIGCGRGGFILERLASDPSVRMVGVEIRGKLVRRARERLEQRGLRERAIVLEADAREVLPRLAESSFEVIFVHFPDPWWKRRHGKRRLISRDLVSAMARSLANRGLVFVQTDVRERAEEYRALLNAESSLVPLEPSEQSPWPAHSPRERRVARDGLPVTRLLYRRQ